MLRTTPRSTRTDTLVPYPTPFLSASHPPRAPRRSALIGERSIVRIRAVIEPVFQRLPAGLLDRGLLKLAVLHGDHAPAAGLEDIVEAAEHAVGCRRVQRLAIIVYDPPAVPEIVLIAFDQTLVDVAFSRMTLCVSPPHRSEEHTSELQSLMRTSYAVFCLKK